MKLEKELQEIIDSNKINIISTIEEIDEIYDYELMMKTNDVVVREGKEDEINIIIFDTDVYNSTCLLDTFKEYIDEEGELLDHVKVHYCNNLSVYKILFDKYFRKNGLVDNSKSTDSNLVMKQIEQIEPTILAVVGFDDEIYIEMGLMNPITVATISNLFNTIN